MRAERLLKKAGVGLAGVVGGVALAIAALIGIVFLVVWATQDSPTTHARKEAQSFFDVAGTRTAAVKNCTKIGSDQEALIYRCQVVAPGCVRTHRFAVYRDRMYGADLYSVSGYVSEHPCKYPSDWPRSLARSRRPRGRREAQETHELSSASPN
jgi:hypothetical protein